jgi:polyisoprenyl-phosphate glycosyltransferase
VDISIVIPVYRSKDTLRPLTERICAVMNQMGLQYEIVFVNDDSPDSAWEIIEALHAESPERIVGIDLTRNFGQHNALMCGFREARGRYVLTMDDDLQHLPEEIPKLISTLEREELDVVYGRYLEKRHKRWRNAGSSALNAVYKRVFAIKQEFTSLRLIRREIVDAALAYDLNFTFIDGLLAWNTRRIGGVDVAHAARSVGKSGYSLSKLILLSFNLLTNFSLLPLQLASVTGLIAAATGLGVGLFYLCRALLGAIVVPGYASLITCVLFLGGIQLLSLGIIGEYVGRLHLNVSRKPQYRIRHKLTARPAAEANEPSRSPS